MTLYIDYAWTKPNAQAIYDAGYRGVMRYLSNDSSKDLSIAEAAALHKAGLGIGLVWETTADRARAGQTAGAADAKSANAKADALGFPESCPIFYAVDYDAVVSDITPYFVGIKTIAGRPVGVYGSYYVVKAMMGTYANYGWQTMAWSGGNKLTIAHLFQTLNHTWPISGVVNSAWDENVLQHSFPLWNPTTQEEELPMALTVKNPLTGAQWAADDALWSIWTYAIQAAQSAGAALEVAKTLAATDATSLTAEEIQAAAQRGAQAAIDAEITSATVNLNVTQPGPTP